MKQRLMLTTMGFAALLAGSAMAAETAAPPTSGTGSAAGSSGSSRTGGSGSEGAGAASKDMAPGQGSAGSTAPKAESDSSAGKSADAPAGKDEAPGQKGKASGKDASGKAAAKDTDGKADKMDGKTGDKAKRADDKSGTGDRSGKSATGPATNDKAGDKAAERTGSPSVTGDQQKTQAKKVEITGEKRTRVTTVFTQHRSEARTDLNIQVNVGAVVPRSAKLYVIPQDVVIVAPEYRAYRYIIVGNNVVIIDPADYTIIDVLPLVA